MRSEELPNRLENQINHHENQILGALKLYSFYFKHVPGIFRKGFIFLRFIKFFSLGNEITQVTKPLLKVKRAFLRNSIQHQASVSSWINPVVQRCSAIFISAQNTKLNFQRHVPVSTIQTKFCIRDSFYLQLRTFQIYPTRRTRYSIRLMKTIRSDLLALELTTFHYVKLPISLL